MGTTATSRRQLLRFTLTSAAGTQRMPWTVTEAAFIDQCSRCGACVEACPEGIIVRGDGGFPEVDFRQGGCTFCGACVEACPEPVFRSVEGPPWHQQAVVSPSCLTEQGIVCQSCADACDARAIHFGYHQRVPRPKIDTTQCTGCGACVGVCPSQAIGITATHQGDAV